LRTLGLQGSRPILVAKKFTDIFRPRRDYGRGPLSRQGRLLHEIEAQRKGQLYVARQAGLNGQALPLPHNSAFSTRYSATMLPLGLESARVRSKAGKHNRSRRTSAT
jgi:hypothetical protein